MKLSGLVSRYFESQVRQRGRRYYERARVEIYEGSSSEVYGVVSGTREYDVFLSLEENNLIVECSCPYFSSNGPCKHIWAALLYAEENGYLIDFNTQRPIRLKQTGMGDEEDLFEDEFSEERYDYNKDYYDFNRDPEKHPPQKQWRKIIDGIQQKAGAIPSIDSDYRLRERQLVYIIDVDATLERSDLCLTVSQKERKLNGDWGRLKSIRLAYTTISGLSDPKDREIVPLLNGIHGTSHHLRFSKSQFFILDVLLASQAQTTCDETFALMRERLRSFESIKPSDPRQGFNGKLRDYQKEGLGWLFFLKHFGLGGCLADDMGLGKTIQVLALLESRRPSCHSLVVVPRSLIFNWRQEASRFTPRAYVS